MIAVCELPWLTAKIPLPRNSLKPINKPISEEATTLQLCMLLTAVAGVFARALQVYLHSTIGVFALSGTPDKLFSITLSLDEVVHIVLEHIPYNCLPAQLFLLQRQKPSTLTQNHSR